MLLPVIRSEMMAFTRRHNQIPLHHGTFLDIERAGSYVVRVAQHDVDRLNARTDVSSVMCNTDLMESMFAHAAVLLLPMALVPLVCGCAMFGDGGIDATYPNGDHAGTLPYRSYPHLVATAVRPSANDAPRLRRLIDSLGLQDVSARYVGGDADGAFQVLARKDGRPFDRMHSPELRVLRSSSGYYYGPIVRFTGQGPQLFSMSLGLDFKESVPEARRAAVLKSLNARLVQSVAGAFGSYSVAFDFDIGEGIVDTAYALMKSGDARAIWLNLIDPPSPLK